MFTYPIGFLSSSVLSSFLTHILSQQTPNSTSFVMTRPTPMNQGDLMVALIAKDDTNTITPPSGWTPIEQQISGGSVRFDAYFKEAGSSEPSTYTFFADKEEWVGAIIRITGHLSGNPINRSGAQTGTSDEPITPDISTWTDGCLILRAFGLDTGNIIIDTGFPTAHTGIFINRSSALAGAVSAGAAHTTQSTKGSTGTAIFSADDSERYIGMTIAISPSGTVEVPNYFGDGTDGDVTISTNTSLAATLDGNPVIKHYNSLTINSGVFLTTNNRCKGLLIYVKGDCTINGTLKMDNRGASAAASADLDLSRFQLSGAGSGAGPDPLFPDESNQAQTGDSPGIFTQFLSAAAGASGGGAGIGGGSNPGGNGSAGGANQTGGGAGGGGSDNAGRAGAAGTAFSGGTGGGGAGGNSLDDGSDGGINGGPGGDGETGTGSGGGGGGGCGNPGGSGGGGVNAGGTGASGTGGSLWLIVGGSLTIGASGIISADATGSGGNGGADGGAGGGGAGGGRIVILYKGILSNSGTIRANGSAGGSGSGAGIPPGGIGGAGGAGDTDILQIT